MDYALPSWFELPVAMVRDDCKLRPDQYSGPDGGTKMDEEIERRIPELGAFVLGRLQDQALQAGLIADLENDLAGVLSSGQKLLARTATRLLVIAALYGVMPGDKATTSNVLTDGRGEVVIGLARLGSAESILNSIESQIKTVAAAKSGASQASESIEVDRAHISETEYFKR